MTFFPSRPSLLLQRVLRPGGGAAAQPITDTSFTPTWVDALHGDYDHRRPFYPKLQVALASTLQTRKNDTVWAGPSEDELLCPTGKPVLVEGRARTCDRHNIGCSSVTTSCQALVGMTTTSISNHQLCRTALTRGVTTTSCASRLHWTEICRCGLGHYPRARWR